MDHPDANDTAQTDLGATLQGVMRHAADLQDQFNTASHERDQLRANLKAAWQEVTRRDQRIASLDATIEAAMSRIEDGDVNGGYNLLNDAYRAAHPTVPAAQKAE